MTQRRCARARDCGAGSPSSQLFFSWWLLLAYAGSIACGLQVKMAADSADTNVEQKPEQTSVAGKYSDDGAPKDGSKDTKLAPAKATKAA